MKNYCPESLAAYFLLNLMKSDLSYQIESFLIHSQDDMFSIQTGVCSF